MEFNEFLILDHRANYSDMIFPSAVAVTLTALVPALD